MRCLSALSVSRVILGKEKRRLLSEPAFDPNNLTTHQKRRSKFGRSGDEVVAGRKRVEQHCTAAVETIHDLHFAIKKVIYLEFDLHAVDRAVIEFDAVADREVADPITG